MKIKNIFITGLVILFIFFNFNTTLYNFITGFFYNYDLILEYKINRAFKKVQETKNLQPIALKEFTDKKISRACIQTPYEPQFSFEERLKAKVNNYRETNDDGMYVVWLFFSDGSIAKIRPYQMEPGKGLIICKEQVTSISFKQEKEKHSKEYSIEFSMLGE